MQQKKMEYEHDRALTGRKVTEDRGVVGVSFNQQNVLLQHQAATHRGCSGHAPGQAGHKKHLDTFVCHGQLCFFLTPRKPRNK